MTHQDSVSSNLPSVTQKLENVLDRLNPFHRVIKIQENRKYFR